MEPLEALKRPVRSVSSYEHRVEVNLFTPRVTEEMEMRSDGACFDDSTGVDKPAHGHG